MQKRSERRGAETIFPEGKREIRVEKEQRACRFALDSPMPVW